MAECVPADLPKKRPGVAGERRVFDWLRDLPADCLVYYEPITGRRYPDFVVVLPSLGVLVVEVKSWKLADLRVADGHHFEIASATGKTAMVQTAPVRQARDYVHALMDHCAAHLWGRSLRWEEGPYRGKFRFPFAHAVVLTEVRRGEIEARPELTELLPPAWVLTADELAVLGRAEPAAKLAAVRRFFDLFRPVEPLGPAQLAALRAIIHPEVQVGAPTRFGGRAEPPAENLKVLDLEQERAGLAIGGGHRLVFGPAGSGKTVMLLARARLLATLRPEARILVLCFNVTLAAYLGRNLREFGDRMVVANFHKMVRGAKIDWREVAYEIDPNELGLELLRLREDDAISRHFDALFIDEAQDFAPSWFQAALGLVRNPDEADVFIVGDGSQGIFGTGKRRFTWASVGIHASGRTTYLARPYRSSREIIALAARFAASSGPGEDGVAAVAADPALVRRQSGFAPWLVRGRDRSDETDRAVRIIRGLVEGKWRGKLLGHGLAPEEIGVLYARREAAEKKEFERLLAELKKAGIRYNWLSADQVGAREGIGQPGVRLQTIASAKGLQYRAVILLWADQLPKTWGEDQDPVADRLLLYVALTRAEDFLAVLTSGESAFIAELRAAASA